MKIAVKLQIIFSDEHTHISQFSFDGFRSLASPRTAKRVIYKGDYRNSSSKNVLEAQNPCLSGKKVDWKNIRQENAWHGYPTFSRL